MSGRKGKGGRDGVREGIEGAQVVELRPGAARSAAAPAPAVSRLSRRFMLREEGLFRVSTDPDKPDSFLCGPIEVLGESRDEDGRNWGLLLKWSDRDGREHQEAFARALFAGDGAEIRARLADAGLTLNPAPYARAGFMEWLSSISSSERARSVTRIGWHTLASGPVFVLPDETIGETVERVVLQVVDREPSLFGLAGSARDWSEPIGRLCVGNSRLVFAACCAFAAPLLSIVGEEGGGFSLKGASRLGKSTALRIAASICGGTAQHGASGFVRSWRSTSNGIESTALASCDVLLPLDEMGQLDAREAGEIAYLLSNGQGKARASRTGAARSVSRFRVLFLSTGELGLADLNREAGKATKAGQEVRFADLPADAGAGMGLFENLHGEDTPDAFAKYLREATSRCYGAPLRGFLIALTEHLRRTGLEEMAAALRSRANAFLDRWLHAHADASGQVRSVAYRFALVAIGGELATEYGLTGWANDVAGVATEMCFQAWLTERGTVGRREEDQAVAQLRDFLSRHGESRFEKWFEGQPDEARQAETPLPPSERFRTQHRAGWRRWLVENDSDGSNGVWRYYLTAEAMSEALNGLNHRDAKRTLIERAFLVPGRDGKTASLISPPGHKKVRAYEILASIMAADEGDQ
ncbi:DUF927 domain-containing protein [Acetobacteraceae bacterium KSS8]|uniref:DUF927 domain-containing protein n=1 Tax=Endosaccharibacter trunci TaxID=2812733 RepID=A0ABT1WAI9_9PROT|nr:DUF927 domain-containing protein [Acetobacteraceae bacterium KSS8]